jgi:ribosomal protein S8E
LGCEDLSKTCERGGGDASFGEYAFNCLRKYLAEEFMNEVRCIRVRGGNSKFQALRLDIGNFSWGSEVVTRKTRILDVVYNASNNELVRIQILVKNAIIQVDAAPFRTRYNQHYGLEIG